MRRTANRWRKGNAAFTAVTIVTLLGFATLTVDIGHARKVKAELRNACEAGVHSGVAEIDFTTAGVTAAVNAAVSTANLNLVDGVSPGITSDDVVTGVWDGSTFTTSSDASEINALRIVRTQDTSAIFGNMAFGASAITAGASATAFVRSNNSTQSDCYLPLAIPDCRFMLDQDTSTIESTTYQMTDANADNIAWALPQEDNPSAHDVNEYIENGFCSAAGSMEDEVVSLNTGAMADAFRSMRDALEESETTWDSDRWGLIPEQASSSSVDPDYYGNVIEGPIMMFAPPSSGYCADADGDGLPDGTGQFNEDNIEITGIAWAVIFDVKTQGGGGGSGAAGNIKMKLDLDYEAEGSGGDGDYNTGVTHLTEPWVTD